MKHILTFEVFVGQQTHKCRIICGQASHVRNLHPVVTTYDHIFQAHSQRLKYSLLLKLDASWNSQQTDHLVDVVHWQMVCNCQFLQVQYYSWAEDATGHIWIAGHLDYCSNHITVLFCWINAPDDPVKIFMLEHISMAFLNKSTALEQLSPMNANWKPFPKWQFCDDFLKGNFPQYLSIVGSRRQVCHIVEATMTNSGG